MLYHGTIVFEVPYKGKWYRIDALHAKVSLYEKTDVPSEVAERTCGGILPTRRCPRRPKGALYC